MFLYAKKIIKKGNVVQNCIIDVGICTFLFYMTTVNISIDIPDEITVIPHFRKYRFCTISNKSETILNIQQPGVQYLCSKIIDETN